jgi:ABC-type glutathione transport system ATPase component
VLGAADAKVLVVEIRKLLAQNTTSGEARLALTKALLAIGDDTDVRSALETGVAWADLERLVEAQAAFPITSIVISHDMLSTFRIADQIVMIQDGQVVAAGTPDALRAHPDERVQKFIFAGAPPAPETKTP